MSPMDKYFEVLSLRFYTIPRSSYKKIGTLFDNIRPRFLKKNHDLSNQMAAIPSVPATIPAKRID